MAGQGFTQVYNLNGGIKAWGGEKAHGPVELHLDLVRGDETPAEMIKLAYAMERGLGGFYREIKTGTQDEELSNLLETLAAAEEKHERYLLARYNEIESTNVDQHAFEARLTSPSPVEGGFDAEELLRQNRQFVESVASLLDLSMMMETQALDLYLRFAGKIENASTKEALYRIADEEKSHLQALGRLRDSHVD
jgi:sulfur-carrier protein adenylyltransferase/sulfurtransferase